MSEAKVEQRHLDRAKDLLREHLSKHPDDGVRAMNEAFELPDDAPQVQRVAQMLAEREWRP